MGVKNLWRLLLPVGHRLSIETLSHQTLAIDASIWLTQISKACRDPETGRTLPNKPHVRIFLLRLMKLLYHQIKPVVVFDGVMPEVKRREIQRRRARRERLWRDNDDDNACYSDDSGEGKEKKSSTSFGVGGGALKRAAKKILVRQLKEWREREARLLIRRKKRNKNDDDDDSDECDPDHEDNSGETKNQPGAFAAGFTLDTIVGESVESIASPSQPRQHNDDLVQDPTKDTTRMDDNKIEVITINSDDEERDHDANHPSALKVRDEATHKQHELLDDDDDDDDDDDEKSDNDWEMARAVQLSMNDSIHQQQKRQRTELSLTSSNPNTNPHDNSQNQQFNDIEAIASLPSEARYQWIDSQWKTQRIQSRRECIQAAANPEEYSMTQLRNFYKSNALAKRVGEISNLLETKTEDGAEGSNTQHARHARPELQRLRRHNQETSSTDDDDDEDEDNEIFVSSSNNAIVSRKVLFGEDDSDEENDVVDDGCGGDGEGGFLISSATAASAGTDKIRKEVDIELFDDGSDSDDCLQHSDGGARSQRDSFTSLNVTNNDDCIINDHDDNPANNRRVVKDHLAQLHEMSTAEQEWAEWGGQLDHEIGVNSTKKAEVLDCTESGSDEEEMEGTFLVIDQATKSLNHSRTTKDIVKSDACALTVTNSLEIKGDDAEDDDIEWEDGDSEASVQHGYNPGAINDDLQSSLQEAKTTRGDNHAKFMNHHSVKDHNLSSPDQIARLESTNYKPIEIPSDEDENEEMQHEHHELNELKTTSTPNINAVLATNNFDVSSSESSSLDDQQAAALQRAQATASNLTSWAGRAFQRAISTLTTHQTCQNNQCEDAEVVTTVRSTDQCKVTADETGASQSTASLSREQSHNFPAENRCNQRMPTLFDTSLQGLTNAHNAILEEEKTMERDMSTITDEMKADILDLLQLCGVPWIESPSEAEAQCAALEELGLVDGVVTEDSDIFIFGGQKVYKNFFNEQKFVEAYFARDIERDLALKKHQLVALAMLLGGDYTDGVKGVGIVNGMEILQAFPIDDSEEGIKSGLQRFREWLDGFEDPPLKDDDDDDDDNASLSHKEYIFHNKHKSARSRWVAPVDFPSSGILNAYLKPAVDKTQAKFTWATPDLQGLQCYCAETIGWDIAETDRVVNPVLKILESGSKQTRIESYFMKYEDGVKFAKIRSKRLKAVLTNIQGRDDNSIEVEVDDAHVTRMSNKSKPKKIR